MNRRHHRRRIGLTGVLLLGLAACQAADWPRYRVDRVRHSEQEFLARRPLTAAPQPEEGLLSLGDTYLRFCPTGDRPCLLVRGTFPRPDRFRGEWSAPGSAVADRSRFECQVGTAVLRCTETLREESGRTARVEHTFTRVDG